MDQEGSTVFEAPGWDELTRFEQRALIKLFGGGSLRHDDPAVVAELRLLGFVDENDALSMPGLLVLTPALRHYNALRSMRQAS
jgi:hypothetical protein